MQSHLRIPKRTGAVLLMQFVALGGLVGCHIPNRMYRTGGAANPAMIEVPPPPTLPMASKTAWPPHPEKECDEKQLEARPCLAFLEFDDFGEVWQKGSTGHPHQLTGVERLIHEAREQDKDGQPLILLFIHGWKHNASAGKADGADDTNIIGLASELDELHQNQWHGHVVIGIYVSWRGGLISPDWPVAQQFTYWNREATAMRVGNTSMTDALIEIADTAKSPPMCTADKACAASPSCLAASQKGITDPNDQDRKACTPVVVYTGHSFGALVMERALSQATITRMENEYNQAKTGKVSGAKIAVTPLVDLVIYVNSAAAATESKQVMDYLAYSRFIYRPYGRDEPIFLSVTSQADLATGALLKIGHAVPLLGYKYNGSMRANSGAAGMDPEGRTSSYARVCFDPRQSDESAIRTDLSQSDYFMTTTAHREQLWSDSVGSTPLAQPLDAPGKNPSCTRAPSGDDPYMICVIGVRAYTVSPVPRRCNGTPYWVMEVDKDIIPDHGTIFTKRLLAFLMPFIPLPHPGTSPQPNPATMTVQ